MDQVDRYVLGLAVLEGDRDARKILADLLEEQGDRGLAAWARTCKGKLHYRLQLATMLLPCRTALRLACDFVSAARFDAILESSSLARAFSVSIQSWLEDEMSDDQIATLAAAFSPAEFANLASLIPQSATEPIMRREILACEELMKAVHFLRDAREAQGVGDHRMQRHWEEMTRHGVRRIAALTGAEIPLTAHEGANIAGMVWQAARVREVLQSLIAGDETWPK